MTDREQSRVDRHEIAEELRLIYTDPEILAVIGVGLLIGFFWVYLAGVTFVAAYSTIHIWRGHHR